MRRNVILRSILIVVTVIALVAPATAQSLQLGLSQEREQRSSPCSATELRKAALEAMNQYIEEAEIGELTPFIVEQRIWENWGYISIGYKEVKAGEPAALLARCSARSWSIALPIPQEATRYDDWLRQIPTSVLSEQAKERLYILPMTHVSSAAVATGYHYPWANGWQATLTQGPVGDHDKRYDFDLKRGINGIWDDEGDPVETPEHQGFVVAAKEGCVVFAKDVSPDDHGCTSIDCYQWANAVIIRHAENEFSWYYHLAYNSVPDELQDPDVRNDAFGLYQPDQCKAYVEAGQVIGREGATGWTYSERTGGRATHLHFMVTSDVPEHLRTIPMTDTNRAPWSSTYLDVSFIEGPAIITGTVYTSTNELNWQDAVVLYFDANYIGPAVKYRLQNIDQPLETDVPSWFNDAASSIRVSYPYAVSLHRHNREDAARWRDDRIQRYACNINIPDFKNLNYPSGGSLQDSVSRVIVERCGTTSASTLEAVEAGEQAIADTAQFHPCEHPYTVLPPVLRNPADNATLVDPNRYVVFRWDSSPSPDIQDYQLRIKTVPDMEQGGEQIHDVVVGNTWYEFSFPADYGVVYWSVRARDRNQQWSEWAQWQDQHIPRFSISAAPSGTAGTPSTSTITAARLRIAPPPLDARRTSMVLTSTRTGAVALPVG